MVRMAGKGDYYVYQDQNYNVTALVDQGGADIEKYDYTPCGELTVSQVSGPGDYDGDGDVDATDRAAAESMGTCRGANPEGACRILDLDFDADVDDDDLTLFDLLDQDDRREPDRPYSRIGFRFGHQGLFYDAEIESYQNRARQYLPKLKRFAQRDPLGVLEDYDGRPWRQYFDGANPYAALRSNPIRHVDAQGKWCSGWSATNGGGGGWVATGGAPKVGGYSCNWQRCRTFTRTCSITLCLWWQYTWNESCTNCCGGVTVTGCPGGLPGAMGTGRPIPEHCNLFCPKPPRSALPACTPVGAGAC